MSEGSEFILESLNSSLTTLDTHFLLLQPKIKSILLSDPLPIPALDSLDQTFINELSLLRKWLKQEDFVIKFNEIDKDLKNLKVIDPEILLAKNPYSNRIIQFKTSKNKNLFLKTASKTDKLTILEKCRAVIKETSELQQLVLPERNDDSDNSIQKENNDSFNGSSAFLKTSTRKKKDGTKDENISESLKYIEEDLEKKILELHHFNSEISQNEIDNQRIFESDFRDKFNLDKIFKDIDEKEEEDVEEFSFLKKCDNQLAEIDDNVSSDSSRQSEHTDEEEIKCEDEVITKNCSAENALKLLDVYSEFLDKVKQNLEKKRIREVENEKKYNELEVEFTKIDLENQVLYFNIDLY
ncbi:hypothetical protein HK099_001831 [Clydaea vesicula]|uniref:Uncharacterized protein n=1 Tax=Clydaea vesicula TaxID=447962 RepID=A0AAD5TTC8_9FUNG|nr:hypothetical protein HK099_001831 [Clydaea vesicula]